MHAHNVGSDHTGSIGSRLAFIACDGRESSGGAAAQPRRREVAVSGKRVKVIDVHAHCVIPKALALMGRQVEHGFGEGIDEVGPRRLAEMDAQGIDVEGISINPNWYHLERDLSAEVVRINNEALAELCASHPDRFVGFASLSLQAPALAVEELEHAMRKLGHRGAAIGGNVQGEEFADPKFHPVWAKAEELGAVLFIHPQGVAELSGRFRGNGWLGNTIGNPLDTTIALSHLIFEGTLDRFPGLKILAAHGGGYLPSYPSRSDNSLRTNPATDTGVKLKKRPSEYLRQMFFDTLVFTDEMLRHLAAEVGVTQLCLGTDHPYPWQSRSVDHILDCPYFSDAEKRLMLGETASKLLGVEQL